MPRGAAQGREVVEETQLTGAAHIKMPGRPAHSSLQLAAQAIPVHSQLTYLTI